MTAVVPQPLAPVPADRHLKTVRAEGSWSGSMTTEVRIREFGFRTDEPVAIGGTNSAPTPMEFIAGAVNGCVTVVVETVAKELGIPIKRIETATTAHMDVRGFRGTADVSPHFRDCTLEVRVDTPAAAPALADLVMQVERRCPAINLLRDAGVDFELRWDFRALPAGESAGA